MKKLFINHGLIGLLLIAISTSGLSCKLFQPSVPPELSKKVTLEYWGVWHDSDHLKGAIDEYTKLHKNVTIKYKKFRLEEYRQKLLEGWAEDKGPDMYQIPAGWITEFENRITPMPKKVKLLNVETKTSFGKTELINVIKVETLPTVNELKNQFVEVVNKDIIRNDAVYGLPLSVDTLALFYNRDILDNAQVATPPTTWEDMAVAVKAITQKQATSTIVQSAIALGTVNNIPRAVDIVATIMQQNGATMIKNNRAAFSETKNNASPAIDAINFYQTFANPLTEVYSWNEQLPDALEAFISGKTAMFYGYSYQISIIKGRAPKLNFGVAPMTQINTNNPINTANYWVETVSHKSKNIDNSWGFINFLTSQEQAKKWAEKTGRPAALRLILAGQKQDPLLTTFAVQALTASRWYTGKNEILMEQYFNEMVNQVIKIQNTVKQQEAINIGVKKINETW